MKKKLLLITFFPKREQTEENNIIVYSKLLVMTQQSIHTGIMPTANGSGIFKIMKALLLALLIPASHLPAISQQYFINSDGVIQYYIANNDWGMAIVAPPHFSIKQEGMSITVFRGSVAGLPPNTRIVLPLLQTTLADIKTLLQTPENQNGMQYTPVGYLQNLGDGKVGTFFTGVFNGIPVDGYMAGALSAFSTGAIVVEFTPKPGMEIYGSQTLLNNHQILLKSAATDQLNKIVFYKPGTSLVDSEGPTQTNNSYGKSGSCKCCAGSGGAGCSACNSTGQKTVQETRYQGDRTIYQTTTKSCTSCFGSGKTKCTCCFGSGKG